MEEIYGTQLEQEQEQNHPVSIYEYQNTPENRSWAGALPVKQGLYDPELEKDACGVGFAASVHIDQMARYACLADFRLATLREQQATRSSAMVSVGVDPR